MRDFFHSTGFHILHCQDIKKGIYQYDFKIIVMWAKQDYHPERGQQRSLLDTQETLEKIKCCSKQMDKRDAKQRGKRIFNMSQLSSHQKTIGARASWQSWSKEFRSQGKSLLSFLTLWFRSVFKSPLNMILANSLIQLKYFSPEQVIREGIKRVNSHAPQEGMRRSLSVVLS